MPDPLIDLDAAVLAVAAHLDGGHDLIAALDDPYGHPAELPEDLEDLPRAALEAFVAVERPLCSEERRALPDLDGWVEELQDPWIGHAVRPGEELLVEPGNRFDVLP